MPTSEQTLPKHRFRVQEEWDEIEAAFLERCRKDDWPAKFVARLKEVLQHIGSKK